SFVQDRFDHSDSRVVAGGSRDRTTDVRSRVSVSFRDHQTLSSADRDRKKRQDLVPLDIVSLLNGDHLVHVKNGHDVADLKKRTCEFVRPGKVGRRERMRSAVRNRLLQNEFDGVWIWRFLNVCDLWHR